ncbi:stage III sporulation protein AF [Thermolongibacillus altinsuensis]|uniref:Stage III sporulation protein AF n=1 Tax=Thermolongibacillus altinsuensis TaxID=575256 RepID=A0A4R1QE64_9BACL|nr:stage III sporulation protein AF [Thermolongibacillus altinsuensis]TCL48767.1 stage III sporulation protein AF [Thermolongibacillus altinsuensis]
MGFLTEWISHIITFILLAVVIELILPNGSFQKYVKMVVGLLLIVVIFSPIFRLFTGDVEKMIASFQKTEMVQNESIENEIEKKKTEIQASQHAYILEQMAVQMKTVVAEELMRTYGLTIADLSFVIAKKNEIQIPQDIEKINVVLTNEQDERAISTIKPIDVHISSDQINEETTDLATFLASKWEVDEKKIAVQLERRE